MKKINILIIQLSYNQVYLVTVHHLYIVNLDVAKIPNEIKHLLPKIHNAYAVFGENLSFHLFGQETIESGDLNTKLQDLMMISEKEANLIIQYITEYEVSYISCSKLKVKFMFLGNYALTALYQIFQLS